VNAWKFRGESDRFFRRRKGLDNTEFHAAIAGAVSGAYHVRAVAEQYGVPVILHTDHCVTGTLPSGNSTKNYGKSQFFNIFHGKTHYEWPFSIVFCMFTPVFTNNLEMGCGKIWDIPHICFITSSREH